MVMRLSRQWLWLVLLIPVLLGLGRLRLDVEVLNLLPGDSPVVQGLKLFQMNFSNARELIVTVESPDAELTDRMVQTISESLRGHVDQIEDVASQPPWMEQPDQAAELVAFLWLNQRPELFDELVRRLAETNRVATLAAAREQLATS